MRPEDLFFIHIDKESISKFPQMSRAREQEADPSTPSSDKREASQTPSCI